MSEKKPVRRITRFFGFITFRVVPALLIIGILWFSYGVVQAVARRVSEQADAEARSAVYAGTLTAIQPTLATYTPTATTTPTAAPTDTATPTPTYTLTTMPTLTFTSTPTNTPTATPSPVQVAQVFATNTPRSAVITLPPMNTVAVTPTSTFTATLSPTPTPSQTPTLPAATETPRPLPTLLMPAAPDTNVTAPTAIPSQVPAVDRHGYDLVNILLMGGDEELTGDSFIRTDTMIIVSINRNTSTVSMLSLPRDLFVYIPGWTMQRLNLAYTHGEQVGWQPDGGWGLMRQTIFYNLGINVHFYAIINLSGFKQVIDTLGGVDVAVDCAIRDYPLIGANPPAQAQPGADNLYTLPVGFYQLDGEGALWYARSRKDTIEFDRGRRQQQILRAIWRKARDTGQLTRVPELWTQLTNVVKTNLAFEDMLGLLPLALSLDPARIESFHMARLYHTTPWQTPGGDFVQLPNYDAILELLNDFYQPPTENQAVAEGAQIIVRNGTAHADWDRVAAERLAWEGFSAVSGGAADNPNYADTVLIDYTGQTKGSSLDELATILNVRPENVIVQPDPNRTADFEVILGSSYNSCDAPGVMPVEEEG